MERLQDDFDAIAHDWSVLEQELKRRQDLNSEQKVKVELIKMDNQRLNQMSEKAETYRQKLKQDRQELKKAEERIMILEGELIQERNKVHLYETGIDLFIHGIGVYGLKEANRDIDQLKKKQLEQEKDLKESHRMINRLEDKVKFLGFMNRFLNSWKKMNN